MLGFWVWTMTSFFQPVLKIKTVQFLAHALFKIRIRFNHGAAEHENIRIEGVKQSHDGFDKIVTEPGEHFLRLVVAAISEVASMLIPCLACEEAGRACNIRFFPF
jgi:hypothetical protein